MSQISFRKGLEFYKAGKYQESLLHFDEAVAIGGQNLYQILDTRAAVYAKLGQYKEALKDAKKTIDISPERWQGYARAARIFRQLNRIDPAQTMITMALGRLQDTESDRHLSLLALQDDIQNARNALDLQRKWFTDHISRLPIELFGEIARELVEHDHTALIPLLHVCKRWRMVMEDSPHLWAKLVLTSRRPKSKAKFWIEKSKGKIKELIVTRGASWTVGWPGNSLNGLIWDSLIGFKCQYWSVLAHLHSIRQEEAIIKWISLAIESVDGPILSLPGQSTSFSLQSLLLKNVSLDLDETKFCERIRFLRKLTLRQCTVSGSWTSIFEANPLLEELELQSVAPIIDPSSNTNTVLELNHLTTLKVIASVPVVIFKANMPRLHSLSLGLLLYDPNVFVRHLTNTPVGGVTELRLSSCRLDTNTLLRFLKQSPDLRVLELTRTAYGVESLLNSLSAHHGPPPPDSRSLNDDSPLDPTPILCPKLTHVAFSGCPEVQAGLLLRFIKSRLVDDDAASATSEVQATVKVAKIESLIIDFCPNVEKEWVKRMEELVPVVRCRYT